MIEASERPCQLPGPKRNLVYVFCRQRIERLASTFLMRRELTVVHFAQLEDLLAACADGAPQVMVVDLFLPRMALSRLVEAGGPASKIVFVTAKLDSPQYRARVAEVPGAVLVAGGARFVPRLVEALAEAVGVKHRRHLRTESQLPVQLWVEGHAAAGWLENISESGAKLVFEAHAALPQPGQSALLQVAALAQAPVPIECVRRMPGPGGRRHLGVRFLDLSTEQLRAIQEILGAPVAPEAVPIEPRPSSPEQVRTSVRVPIPPRLSLKVRLQRPGSRQRCYLSVVDLSERGFKGCGTFEMPYSTGERLEVLLTCGGRSVRCSAEMVHRTYGARPWQAGFRFLEVNRVARLALRGLLEEARQRGLRKVQSAGRNRTPAAAGAGAAGRRGGAAPESAAARCAQVAIAGLRQPRVLVREKGTVLAAAIRSLGAFPVTAEDCEGRAGAQPAAVEPAAASCEAGRCDVAVALLPSAGAPETCARVEELVRSVKAGGRVVLAGWLRSVASSALAPVLAQALGEEHRALLDEGHHDEESLLQCFTRLGLEPRLERLEIGDVREGLLMRGVLRAGRHRMPDRKAAFWRRLRRDLEAAVRRASPISGGPGLKRILAVVTVDLPDGACCDPP